MAKTTVTATKTKKKTTTSMKSSIPKSLLNANKPQVVDLVERMEESMGDYSYNVNLFRAFPNVCDGLKPVARRVLYSMSQLNMSSGKPYRKVAAVVGDVLGKYHPHGDTSVTDALVKMAQNFYISQPIVDGHGNYGSISGDQAAAMRYIECRLSKYGMEFLDDIDKNSVEWKDNFDQTLLEPVTLPVKFPNLLLNGSFGIGQGYTTSIPPHSFDLIADNAIKIIKNPNTTLDEIAKVMRPNYPTGGIVINENDLEKAYKTGTGIVKLRAKITHTKEGHLLVSEIPYMTNTGAISDKIQEAVKEEKIDGIADVQDSTNKKNGIKLLIKIKRGFDASVIENKLYKYTPLQVSLNINLIATEDLTFRAFNILELFTKWIEYRRTTLKRVFNHRISKVRRRIHIIDGLLIALADIDAVVKLIKTADDKKDAQAKLVKKYKLTEIQSNAIVELQLYRLTGLSITQLKEELKKLHVDLKEYSEYFSNPKKLDNFIISELEEGKKKYSSPQKTVFTNIEDEGEEAIIENTNHTVFITKEGYVKKLNIDLSAQGTGGKGRSIGKMKETDYIISAFNANNRDNVLCFTDQGRVLLVKVYEFKDTNLSSFGYLLNTYIQLRKGENVVSTLVLENEQYKNEEAFLLFVTKNGLIKRSLISHYNSIPKSGLIAMKLNDSDSLVGVKFVDSDREVIIATNTGLGTRFKTDDVTLTLRVSLGMKAISTPNNDSVVSFQVLEEGQTHLLVVNSGGTGKRVELKSFQPQSRTSKAKIVTKLSPNEKLVQILATNDGDEVTLVGSKKMIKIKTENVPVLIRSSSPKKIFTLDKGEKVLDAIFD